jgi:hypothetical protein
LRQEYKAGLWISSNTIVRPECLDPYIFGDKIAFYLEEAISKITDPNDKEQKECLEGILKGMNTSTLNVPQVIAFEKYLDAIDLRRNTNWRKLYPVISDIVKDVTENIIGTG